MLPFASAFSARFDNARTANLILEVNYGTSSHAIGFTVSSITSLLFWCCPLAIGWLVSAIVVSPVNAMTWRGFQSHVVKEILKSKPSLTDGDSSFRHFGKLTPVTPTRFGNRFSEILSSYLDALTTNT